MIHAIDGNLAGKVALITGANTGIGLEVARDLARLGAEVVLAVRSVEKGEAARSEIERSSLGAKVRVMQVDLASQASIRAFAQHARRELPRLDVLMNNAGVWLQRKQQSVDGIELTWATNVLGYFLLTELLRDALSASGDARIVNVASTYAGGLDLDDVQFDRRSWSASAAYMQSKQANRMWTWALGRRLEGTGVTANALHPGTVDTQLLRGGFGGGGGRTPAHGADTVSWLAAAREVHGQTGRFWVDRHERRCEFHDEASEDRLWSLCEAMTRAR